MKTIWYTKSDLKARILEIREMRESVMLERERELLDLYSAIATKDESWVVDQNGKLIRLGLKEKEKKVSTYLKMKNKNEADLRRLREKRKVPYFVAKEGEREYLKRA